LPLENTAQPIPEIPPVDLEAPKSNIEQLVPPPDPLGEVVPEKSQRFTLASGINALLKVVSSGKKAGENLEGWSKTIGTLGPYAEPILKWFLCIRGLKLPQRQLSLNGTAAGEREWVLNSMTALRGAGSAGHLWTGAGSFGLVFRGDNRLSTIVNHQRI